MTPPAASFNARAGQEVANELARQGCTASTDLVSMLAMMAPDDRRDGIAYLAHLQVQTLALHLGIDPLTVAADLSKKLHLSLLDPDNAPYLDGRVVQDVTKVARCVAADLTTGTSRDVAKLFDGDERRALDASAFTVLCLWLDLMEAWETTDSLAMRRLALGCASDTDDT